MSRPAIPEDGLLLVDKPVGWTSFDVVGKLRGGLAFALGHRVKVGHAGTLDPLASGLLVLGYGRRTKELEGLAGQDKTYVGTLRLGEVTPSFDGETEVEARRPWEHLDATVVRAAVSSFNGPQFQRPPLHSAKHHLGERAYFLAREGARTLLAPVPVVVRSIMVLDIRGPEVGFEVTCGKGTYIRALVRDIGEKLGCGAWLTALRRTRSGAFDVAEAKSPEGWSAWFDQQVRQATGPAP